MSERCSVLVVGGGIAGLSTAFHAARAGAGTVLLCEREPVLAFHASGRNAAMLRHVDGDPEGTALAVRSRELLEELGPGGELFRRTGALYLARGERLGPLLALARKVGLAAELVEGKAALAALVPVLASSPAREGLLVPEDGILDVHAIAEALARGARAAGARVETGVAAEAILAEGDRVTGVRFAGGRTVLADAVVVAAGAWASELGTTCGAPLALTPYRRHLTLLATPGAGASGPIAWSLEPEVYFRPEAGGLLASPCDEDVSPPCVPACSPDAALRLEARLREVAPELLGSSVVRTWACLRTFARDRDFVVGADPRRRGLHWIVGLGGRGMSCGLALGEVVAAGLRGEGPALGRALGPGRLLGPG